MSTGAIIGIVIGAVVVIALLTFLFSRQRGRKLEERRVEARGHREAAEERSREAALARAEAQEREAKAERERLAAEAQAERADREEAEAAELHERAREVDPDGDRDDRDDDR